MAAPILAKHTFSAVVIGLAVAFGAAAQTTSGTATTPSAAKAPAGKTAKATSNPDHGFAETAAMGGMVEVELGNLAQQNGASEQVKQFGKRMVDDHSKANDELKQVASSKDITLPATLDKKHQGDVDKFSKLSGAKFDKAYMSHMVDDHKHDVSDFRKESKSGKDADLKAFAANTLPTLEEHLKLAQSTNDAVKKSK